MSPALQKAANEALNLMEELGVPLSAASAYVHLLSAGATSEQQLTESTNLCSATTRNSLSYLGLFHLVSQDVIDEKTVFFATKPRNAWKAHDTQFYWMRSIHIGDIDDLPPLPEMADESRRKRYQELERLCGLIYDQSAKVHDPLQHRHRDICSPELFSAWLARCISSAKFEIVAVERPPRLPELAPIWVALTRRMRAGVKYTRIVCIDEVIEHGIDIVERDITEYGIDLRLILRQNIGDAFYIIDNKRLIIKNIKGSSHNEREPHFGVYTTNYQIVRRYKTKFRSTYLMHSESARITVNTLKKQIDITYKDLLDNGHNKEANLYLEIARFGKFYRIERKYKCNIDWMIEHNYIKRNESGNVVIVVFDEVKNTPRI